MAHIFPEGRVKESATVSGTGPYSIVGPAGGTFFGFSSEVNDGNTVDYVAINASDTSVEIGRGTVSVGTPTTLSRDTIYKSTNAHAAVNWPASTTVTLFATLRGGVINFGPHDLDGQQLTLSADGTSHVTESPTVPQQIDWTIGGAPWMRMVRTAEGIPYLQMVSTDSGAGAGPFIAGLRDSSSPAANDDITEFQAVGRNTADQSVTYAAMRGMIVDPTDGLEDGALLFRIMTGGVATQIARLDTAQFLVGKTSAGIANIGVQAGIAGRLSCTMDGQDPLQVNRLTSDGQLVRFFKDSVEFGDISITSGTVAITGFTGAHASEWGTGHEPDEEPPLGTLLSAVDEAMPGALWMHPKVRITREARDRAVYGVYAGRGESGGIQVWGSGVGAARVMGPVRNGDLLQASALVGIAERQDDDTPRAWTLGKAMRGDDRTDERLVPCTLKSG